MIKQLFPLYRLIQLARNTNSGLPAIRKLKLIYIGLSICLYILETKLATNFGYNTFTKRVVNTTSFP